MKKLSVALLLALCATAAAQAQVVPSSYTPINPCTFFDSTGGSQLSSGTTYYDLVRGSCNVPTSANAVAIIITASGASSAGDIVVWDAGTEPSPASMAFRGSGTDSSFLIVRLCYPEEECTGEDIAVKARTSSTHVKLVVVGYFEPI